MISFTAKKLKHHHHQRRNITKRNRQKKAQEMNLIHVSTQLEGQAVQINKIRQMLQPMQKPIRSIKKQPELISNFDPN